MIIEHRSQGHYPATPHSERVKRDAKFAVMFYKFGNLLCMTPFYDFRRQVLLHPSLNKTYASVYGLCLGAFLLYACLMKEESAYMNRFDRLLSISSDVVSVFLAVFLIFGRIVVQQKVYETYVRKIGAARYLVGWNYRYEATTFLCIQLAVGHVIFFAIISYNWYVNTVVSGRDYLYLTDIIFDYYCFLSALQTGNQANIIKCRYNMLNRLLERQLENPSQIPEKRIVADILNIGKHYRAAADLVDLCNEMFGWVTVFIFWHTVIELLRFSNLFLILKRDPDTFWMKFASVFLSSMSSLGESIYIIWSCDLASSSGSKMVKLCTKLQGNFATNSDVRNELFRLAAVATSYQPKFTAANFFIIKKGTLLSLISIATTYLIVIVQFNGALQD